MIFLGEIRMFAGPVPPVNWAFCHGQELLIENYVELYGLFGTRYGGDGVTTFALPDLRGRIPIMMGSSGWVNYNLGDKGGVETASLTVNQIPAHTHQFQTALSLGDQIDPRGNLLAHSFNVTPYINDPPTGAMAAGTVTTAGGGEAHPNLQPFFCVNFIIALAGYAV